MTPDEDRISKLRVAWIECMVAGDLPTLRIELDALDLGALVHALDVARGQLAEAGLPTEPPRQNSSASSMGPAELFGSPGDLATSDALALMLAWHLRDRAGISALLRNTDPVQTLKAYMHLADLVAAAGQLDPCHFVPALRQATFPEGGDLS